MKTPLLRASIALAALLLVTTRFAQAQSIVDHTSWQTEVKHQGSRNTCITFSAIAALEARYKRIGQDLDLSEEFLNYVRRVFALNSDWSEIETGGADKRENKIGIFGGGSGVDTARWMANGFAVPAETYWPYRPTEYDSPYEWTDPYWDSQYNANTVNLDPELLPREALNAPDYYYATSFTEMQQPNSPAAIEAALQAGYDVIWDFQVDGNTDGLIWRASSNDTDAAHSMLIVGYNRQSSNPQDHHFICKNSWGPTANPGGFTHVAYDYIQYGYRAGYFESVAPNPRPWPELKLLGRRTITYDGWKGTLDVYHLPGINQSNMDLQNGITDRRVGTFYSHDGTAYRVNGEVYGETLHFWWKNGNSNMRWDEERETPTLGTSRVYRTVTANGAELAGRQHANAGPVPQVAYGGYALPPSEMHLVDGQLDPVAPPTTNDPEQFLGAWFVRAGGQQTVVRFTHRDDSVLSPWVQLSYAALVGTMIHGTSGEVPITLRVNKFAPREVRLAFNHPQHGLFDLHGWMLSWQRGVVAGLGTVDLADAAFYMTRLGNFAAGSKTPYGQECGPVNYAPYHHVLGRPEVGRPLWLTSSNLQPNAVGIVAVGLSGSLSGGVQLPGPLDGIGMPGCNLYVDPVLTNLFVANDYGEGFVVHYFGDHLFDANLYSQMFVLMPGANAAGIVASNGVETHLGGVW